jgi:hypothetical protein
MYNPFYLQNRLGEIHDQTVFLFQSFEVGFYNCEMNNFNVIHRI